MKTEYFYCGGYIYPYWYRYTDEYGAVIAANGDSDTDMNHLTGDEFAKHFRRPMPITQEQFDNRSVTFADFQEWMCHQINAENMR